MLTKDGLDPKDPLPLFLSNHVDQQEQRETFECELPGTSRMLKASILVIAVTASGIAIALSLGTPAKVFADATALLPDTSAPQLSTNQATPSIQSAADAQASQPTAVAIDSTADAQASAPTASEPPTRDEIVAVPQLTSPTQTENSKPQTEALIAEYQAWAAKQNRQAQNAVQPVQEAPVQVVDDAPAPARPAPKHRRVRSLENAQTEIRRVQKPKARIQREQNARGQAPPAQDARAQEQPVQNAQAPSFLQSFGWRQ
jgi:hypothetical protein